MLLTAAKTVAVMGASGFVGRHLSRYLLDATDYSILGLCRHPQSLADLPSPGGRFSAVRCDVFDGDDVRRRLEGATLAYYLIHMMARKDGDFYELEARAAETFGRAARDAGTRRVIYLSGLGDDRDNLSRHLASRHNSGDILRGLVPQVIEFRASMILGAGSISFDIVTNLVHRLPVMTLPRWTRTRTQPIGLDDALRYLGAAATVDVNGHEIVEIGGPEAMSYQEFIRRFARSRGKRPVLIRLNFLPEWLAAWWLNLFTPRGHARVGRHMVESFRNPMVVTNDRARELFPDIVPAPIERYLNPRSSAR
jgi:uncharacterized protein YbjT (DUF2867 family)